MYFCANLRKMAADEGVPFMKSNEGCVRLSIIVLLCVAYSMIAVAGYTEVVTWVMAAYIISWILSLQTYFLIAAKVASHMKCGLRFDVSMIMWQLLGRIKTLRGPRSDFSMSLMLF